MNNNAKILNPHELLTISKGNFNLSKDEAWPDGAKAFAFKADVGVAKLSVCTGKSYTGRLWDDPCNVVSKEIGESTLYRVPGEITNAVVEYGSVVFYLLEELKKIK